MRSSSLAIIGAGISGLSAADRLLQGGVEDFTVFEAKETPGGRMATLKAPGQPPVNLGGELIDVDHHAMRGLAERYGVELLSIYSAPHQEGQTIRYDFDGQEIDDAGLFERLAPLLARLRQDAPLLGSEAFQTQLDETSVSRYLREFVPSLDPTAAKIVRAFLVAMNGREADEMPASNFFDYGLDKLALGEWTSLLPNGHGKFVVRGGSQALTDAIAARVSPRLEPGRPLESVAVLPDGRYELSFAHGGPHARVNGLIVTAPLPALRNVDLSRAGLPSAMAKAIRELSYGTNGKVLVRLAPRPENARLDVSHFLSERLLGAQVWENGACRETDRLSITVFVGGKAGARLSEGDVTEGFLDALAQEYPGLPRLRRAETLVKNWTQDAYAGGSYVCPTLGQRSLLSGLTAPAGGFLLAGDHVNRDGDANPDDTGYMDVGARSGAAAAESLCAQA